MQKIIYLHPGQPKTGTSFLQRNYFVLHPKINNIGKKYSLASIKKDLSDAFHQIIHSKELSDSDYKKCLRAIETIEYKENMVNLISFEGFTQTNFEVNQRTIFNRLKNLFSDCNFQLKVFVTVRNQLSIIPSHYANTPRIYLERGPTRWKYFKNFINDIDEIKNFSEKKFIVAYDRYKYFRLLKLLIEIFSEENVKIFFFEEIIKDNNAFFNEICSLMKTETHLPIKPIGALNVTRKKGKELKRINKYFFRSNRVLYYFSKLLPESLKTIIANFFIDIKNFKDPIILNKDQQDMIINYYREDNELLAKYLNKDLKSLGY